MDTSHSLAVHRFLLRAGLSLGNVFVWILIFHALYITGETVAGALFLTAFAYSFLQLTVFFLTPLAGSNVPNGTVRSMLCATLAQSAAFLWFASSAHGVFGSGALNVWWGITGFVFLTALYRAFYWVPYSAVGLSSRGTWSAQTRFLLEIFLALLPVVAATVLVTPGGTWLALVGASAFSFFAALALMSIPDSFERFEWSYTETIRALFSNENKPLFTTSLLEGMQGGGLLFIWPLTIFLLFNWSYLTLGLLLSITFLLVLLTRRSLLKFVRRFSWHQHPRFLAAVAGSAWVLRLVVISPVTIVIADVLYHTAVPPRRLGMDPIAMEQSADGSHFIDEYTALKEMGASLGRVITCIALAIALLFAEPLVALALALIVVASASIISIYHTSEHQF